MYLASNIEVVEMRLKEDQRSECEGSARGRNVRFLLEKVVVKGFANGLLKGGGSPRGLGEMSPRVQGTSYEMTQVRNKGLN